MLVHILSNQLDSFLRKIQLSSKHLDKVPSVTYGEPHMVVETTNHIVDNGWGGIYETRRSIEVIDVEIEDITCRDWTLVSVVFFADGVKSLVDARYFGAIPSYMGIDYDKCDYCGHIHASRSKAYIVYNEKTGEYKQVGSTCVRKLIGNDYLCKFIVNLYKSVEEHWGTMGDDFDFFFKSVPNHLLGQAINVASVLTAIRAFYKESPVWQKGCKYGDVLYSFLSNNDIAPDEDFVAKAMEYGKNLPSSDFNLAIISACTYGYITRYDLFKLFFLVREYEKSQIENPDKEGDLIRLEGAELARIEPVSTCFGVTTKTTFSYNGLEIIKWGNSGFEKYKREDGKYYFSAIVKYVDNKKHTITLGGRAKA